MRRRWRGLCDQPAAGCPSRSGAPSPVEFGARVSLLLIEDDVAGDGAGDDHEALEDCDHVERLEVLQPDREEVEGAARHARMLPLWDDPIGVTTISYRCPAAHSVLEPALEVASPLVLLKLQEADSEQVLCPAQLLAVSPPSPRRFPSA